MSQSLVCDGMSTHIIHTLYFWMARIMINPGLRWQQCDGIHQSRDMNVITILFFHLDFSLNWNFMQKRNVISWWTNQLPTVDHDLPVSRTLSLYIFLSLSLALALCVSLFVSFTMTDVTFVSLLLLSFVRWCLANSSRTRYFNRTQSVQNSFNSGGQKWWCHRIPLPNHVVLSQASPAILLTLSMRVYFVGVLIKLIYFDGILHFVAMLLTRSRILQDPTANSQHKYCCRILGNF